MTTKLTLTIEKSVIEAAKQFASEQNQSLSQLVENYLTSVVLQHDQKKQPHYKVHKLRGIIKATSDINEKELLQEALEKKYMK